MDPLSVAAVLMASGFSRRFKGADKLLVPFRGKPLARHTLELAAGMSSSFKGGIFFIAAAAETAALAKGLAGVQVIRNAASDKGQRESIRLGVEAAESPKRSFAGQPSVPGYYFFFPCDQPFLDAETLSRILEARRPGHIVQPFYRGVKGSPVLFSRDFREELLTLAPGEHGRDIITRHPDCLVRADLRDRGEEPSPLSDIDEPGNSQANCHGVSPRGRGL
jgi:molybdenum cofactor cytidylyltransferase